MAPITWKNIDAPSFRDAILANEYAGQSFNNAIGILSNVIGDLRRTEDANWDNQARLNTEDVLARLQGIGNLNDLHSQKGNYDPAALRADFGAQVNNGQIQAGLAGRLKELQNQAIMGAQDTGLAAAEQGQSAAAGIQAARQALVNSGLQDPTVMNNAMTGFQNNSLAGFKLGQSEQQDAILSNALQQIQEGTYQGVGSVAPGVPANQGDWNGRGLSPAQIQAESNGQDFDKNGNLLTSDKGALGAHQVMPSTATDPGFGVRPADPQVMAGKDKQAIAAELKRVGNDYMDALRARYNGNEAQALAAYNGGPGRLDSVGGDISRMHAESQDYVRKILGSQMQQSPQGSPRVTAAIRQAITQAQDAQREKSKVASINNAVNQGLQILQNTGSVRAAQQAVQSTPYGGEALLRFTQQMQPRLSLLPEEQSSVNTAGAIADAAIETDALADNSLIAGIKDELKAQDTLAQSQGIFDEAGTSIGGLAQMVRSKADDPGFLDRLVPGMPKGNGIIDTITNLQGKFESAGASPEQAGRLVLQTLRKVGGLRDGKWGAKGISESELNKAIPYAIRQEEKISKLKSDMINAQTAAAKNMTRNKALKAQIGDELQQAILKSRFSNGKFKMPDNIQTFVDSRIKSKPTDLTKQEDPNGAMYKKLLNIYEGTNGTKNIKEIAQSITGLGEEYDLW